jgi:hypothetical protein
MQSILDLVLAKENIIHVGAALYLAGFLFREQIVLRCLIVLGDIAFVLYYAYAPETPLWGGIFWSLAFIVVNIVMIATIAAERTQFTLSSEERKLFDRLGTFTPGQFRKLLKLARIRTAEGPVELTREGDQVSELHYVVEGRISISKGGGHKATDSESFVGEVAFLLSRPASATTVLDGGGKYFSWASSELKALLDRKPELASALSNAMNRHMAAKVAAAGVPAAMVVSQARA